MAFTINDSSASNLINLSDSVAKIQIPLNYTLDTSSRWIYCNYPEALTTSDFGDKTSSSNGHCLNQVTVPAGTHRIFFSYQYNTSATNTATTPFYFGIQVFNPQSGTLTFRILHSGYGTNLSSEYSSWLGVAGGSFQDYFASSAQTSHSISANGSYWCVSSQLQNNSGLLSGSIEFSVSASAIITVYIYKSLSNINGYATPVEKTGTGGQYSGYAVGSLYTANTIVLKASELASGKYFLTNYLNIASNMLTVNGASKTSDLLPIVLANPSGTVISPSSSTNLGNWGLIYTFPLQLVNDTSSTVVFNGYVKTDTNSVSNYCIINNNSTSTKYALLKGGVSGFCNAWKWLSQTVAAGQTVTGTYRYVLGTNSCANQRHIFTIS